MELLKSTIGWIDHVALAEFLSARLVFLVTLVVVKHVKLLLVIALIVLAVLALILILVFVYVALVLVVRRLVVPVVVVLIIVCSDVIRIITVVVILPWKLRTLLHVTTGFFVIFDPVPLTEASLGDNARVFLPIHL